MLDHSPNSYAVRVTPEIGSKFTPVGTHAHEGLNTTKNKPSEYAGARHDHVPAHKRTKSQAKYDDHSSSESPDSLSDAQKSRNVDQGPLITSLSADGSEGPVEHKTDSAEAEEALIGQTANKLAPKAAIPELRRGETGTKKPSENNEPPVSNIWKGRLLGPMEPMQLSKARPRPSFGDDRPPMNGPYIGGPTHSLPTEDPGLEGTSLPSDNSSKSFIDLKSNFAARNNHKPDDRTRIPHLSEDMTLANAVATESRRTSQEPQRLITPGKSEEFPNMLADMYSATANGPYLRFLNPNSNPNGSADPFSRFRPLTTDSFTEAAQAPRPSVSQYSSGDVQFRYTYPGNILSPTMFPVADAPNIVGEPYQHTPHHQLPQQQPQHQQQQQQQPQQQQQQQHQQQQHIPSQPQLHYQPPLPHEQHKHSFDAGDPNQSRHDSATSFSLSHINQMPLTHPNSLHQPMSTAAYPVLLSLGPMVPPQAPQQLLHLPSLPNQGIEAPNKIPVSSKPSATPHNPTQPAPPQADERIFHCTHPGCEWSFARSSDQKRHIRSHLKPSLRCPYWELEATCNRKGGLFYRLDVLKRHLKLVHMSRPTNGSNDGGQCRVCMQNFSTTRDFINHCDECAKKAYAEQSHDEPLPSVSN